MIKVDLSKDKLITVSGHSGYEEAGKDIVCASVSSIVITTINAIIEIDSDAIDYSDLDNKIIIKSKNTKNTIWNNECNSINFGPGSDLRIFYDYTSNKNYTKQSSGFDYHNTNNNFILNGEFFFTVEKFEIFQVYF